MQITDFDYELPQELIAQEPIEPRDHSRLLVLGEEIEHKHFYEIIEYLEKGDVLVLNETKVSKAKIVGEKITGSKAEIIIETSEGKIAECIVKTKNPIPGTKLKFGKYKATVLEIKENSFIVEFDEEVKKIMKEIGELPTPPYVKKELEKNEQYQTCYSKTKGSVAAPTAGLHFTPELIEKIKEKGVKIAKVCLHVGFGTFLPVRNIEKEKLHKEYYEVSKETAEMINNRKGRLFVVGTTTIRTLESAADEKGLIHSKISSTELFIKPGYEFRTKIDFLITNFHLPRSTLLMLVSAFAGREKILKAYKEAIKENYRFYSFGDAMLIRKRLKK